MHCTLLKNENPVKLKNCSTDASPTYIFGHRISSAWHELLLSKLNQNDLLRWSVPQCAYCNNSGTKPVHLSLERVELEDEIPVRSPGSQLALSAPKVSQESIAHQSET